MIVLAVTWVAHPTKEAEVAEVFRKLEAASRLEPGCLQFVAHSHRADDARFFIYEQYRDDAALEAHRQSKYFQQYVVTELPAFADRLQGDLYLPLSDKS